MRTIQYSEVQSEVYRLLGWDPDSDNADEFDIVKRGVNRALAEISRRVGANGLTRCELRRYRDAYASGTAYASGDEVYFEATQTYYQALRSTTGNAPATESGGVWTTNAAYWAECARDYSATDYVSTAAYVAGDQAYYPDTGLYYQCHTASTGNAPSDTAYWGPLAAFDAYVPAVQDGYTSLGRVRGVYEVDPRKFAGAPMIAWGRSNNGVEVFTELPTVWVEYDLRPLRFTGTDYSASATYEPADDEDALPGSTLTGGARIYTGSASPEGVVTARPGSIYIQQISSTQTQQWVKASGTGNTGWIT